MGYMHIPNLYKDARVLDFKWCWALEKIYGTSAHVKYQSTYLTPPDNGYADQILYYSGGADHEAFVALFNHDDLLARFRSRECPDVTVYGEAYGGKMQKMSNTYGDHLRFIVFEVKVGDRFLDVPKAEVFALQLGLEFVHYERVDTDVDKLDALRDTPSIQATRNGILEPMPREGIVLRPPYEVTTNDGGRIIAKHKGAAFQERQHQPRVGDNTKLMFDAEQIAVEWVVPERIRHVADYIKVPIQIESISDLIPAVYADVAREAAGEIVETPEARKAISRLTALTIKEMVRQQLRERA